MSAASPEEMAAAQRIRAAAGDISLSRFEPGLLRKVWIIAVDCLYGLWVCVLGLAPVLVDYIYTHLFLSRKDRLPASVAALVDPAVYSRLAGYTVVSVEYKNSEEQHANSTDRAWLRVTKEDGEVCEVFAKVHSQNLLVRTFFFMFPVYDNELNAYATLSFPVMTPKPHVVRWSRSRFTLILEDLRAHGDVTLPNLWMNPPATRQLAESILDSLARIHAKFWGKPPAGIWTDKTRPYFGKQIGFYTMWKVKRSIPENAFPADVRKTFASALWHWGSLRTHWSKTAQTMAHGDAHMGNYFIRDDDGSIGMFDFQCLTHEHCMRDVTYFMCSSLPEELTASSEKDLIKFYLSRLAAHLGDAPSDAAGAAVPTFDEAWYEYRNQSLYALFAFVFSGGFSNLMDECVWGETEKRKRKRHGRDTEETRKRQGRDREEKGGRGNGSA